MSKFKVVSGEGIEATLEKSEHAPTQFDIKDVKKHYENVVKAIKELEAQIRLEEALIGNIERKHKVSKVNEQLKQACYLYMKSKLAIVPAQERLDSLKQSLAEYDTELTEVKEQTGIDIHNL